MLTGVSIIMLLAASLSYLILILNSKEAWLEAAYTSNSLIYSKNKQNHNIKAIEGVLYNFGQLISKLMPKQIWADLINDYFYLDRKISNLYIRLTLFIMILLIGVVLFVSFCFNLLILLSGLLIALTLFLEVKISVLQTKNQVEENIEHIVRCLKILIIKNEIPIINALELILEELPEEMQASKREISKLIHKAQKSGIKNALLEWQCEQAKFRDFISLLISINDGASKYALCLSFDNFLQKIKEEDQEKLKNQAENIQLYLMGPVILMLLVMSLPLMDAVRFMLESTTIQ